MDLFVASRVILELKAIAAIEPVHFAIMRSYLKAMNGDCGLILNFATPTLQVKRVGPKRVLPNQENL